jgi:hypothetical protein
MKAFIYICFLGLITGCAANQAYIKRWNDMWTDIALRHNYQRYACANRLQGYSKEDPPSPRSVARPKHSGSPAPTEPLAAKVNPDVQSARQAAQQANASVGELNQKIDVLEESLKTDVATTNQNQNLIVEQIKELKARVEQLQKPATPPMPVSGVIIPGNQQ